MFVVSKRNIILPGPNGEKFHMPRDYMGPVPVWAESSAYLRALAADGKVAVAAGGRDKDIDAAGKRKREKKAVPSAVQPEGPGARAEEPVGAAAGETAEGG